MNYAIYCRKSTESEDRQVLSLDAQVEANEKFADGIADFEADKTPYRESKSAKTLGRPLFNEMLSRVERGEVQGLIAWHPDRLARNPMDGARILQLLSEGKLKTLKFATFNFDNTPEGRLFLSLLFGQATHYSESLSRSIKRGNSAKLKNGWRPGRAPLGYQTCRDSKTTVPDPERFPLLKRMFKLYASGGYSARELTRKLNDDWGFRTPQKKRSGGMPLAFSSVHRILINPFYAGLISWAGETHPGKHKPMISVKEHKDILKRLGKARTARPKKRRRFAYTGLLKCGECDMSVTAEIKTNRHGSRYVYYHCSRKRRDYSCRQAVTQAASLDQQIEAFLERVSLPDDAEAAAHKYIDSSRQLEQERAKQAAKKRARALAQVETSLSRLIDLRVKGLLDDQEFLTRKGPLVQEKVALESANKPNDARWFEPAKILISFSVNAASAFQQASMEQKRRILTLVGSNPTLRDKELSVHARLPFRVPANIGDCRVMRRFVDNVRTLVLDPCFEENLATINRLLPKKSKEQEPKRKTA